METEHKKINKRYYFAIILTVVIIAGMGILLFIFNKNEQSSKSKEINAVTDKIGKLVNNIDTDFENFSDDEVDIKAGSTTKADLSVDTTVNLINTNLKNLNSEQDFQDFVDQ